MQTSTIFMETGDVARTLGLSAAMVRVLIARGRLTPAARTRRGVAPECP
jgi:hypothetical protein